MEQVSFSIKILQVNWYAHGARYYDPQLARRHSADPLSELYASSSPYGYVINNPMNFVDPDGMRRDPLPWGQEYNTLFLTDGERRLRPDVNAWNNVGRCMSDPGPGVPYTDEDGNTYETGQDPVTGETYYIVEYVKDWWEKSINEEGEVEYRYMKTLPDGSKRVPYDSDSEKESLTMVGLALINDWSKDVAIVFQGSNEAIRAAAIRNGIPTEVIDEIIRKTGNFSKMTKYVGKGFIVAGVVVNVIDAGIAIGEGDYSAAGMAMVDLVAGMGTAVMIGGLPGIIVYGGYMLIMHQPAVQSPAYISDPLSPWNTLPRIDNTYVAPNYNH